MNSRFHSPILRYFFLWMLGLVIVCLGVLYLISGNLRDVESNTGNLILQLLALLPILWFLGMVLRKKLVFDQFFNSNIKPFTFWQYVLVLVLTIVVSIGLEGLISYLLTWLKPQYIEEVAEQAILSKDAGTTLNTMTVFLAVVVAPVMEEIVFRGLIFQRLAIRYNMTLAILLSSAVFGLLHFESFLGAGVFGLFMCLLFYHTRNLWIPIVVHVINNAFAVLIDVLVRHDGSYTFEEYRMTSLIYMIGLLGIPFMYIFFKHNWPKDLGQLPILFHRQ